MNAPGVQVFDHAAEAIAALAELVGDRTFCVGNQYVQSLQSACSVPMHIAYLAPTPA